MVLAVRLSGYPRYGDVEFSKGSAGGEAVNWRRDEGEYATKVVPLICRKVGQNCKGMGGAGGMN